MGQARIKKKASKPQYSSKGRALPASQVKPVAKLANSNTTGRFNLQLSGRRLLIGWVLLVIASLAVFQFMSVQFGGDWRSTVVAELIFDYSPSEQQVRDTFSATSLDVVAVETVGGNLVRVDVSESDVAVANTELAKITQQSVLDKSAYRRLNVDLIYAVLQKLPVAAITFTLLSLAAFATIFKQETRSVWLRRWAVYVLQIFSLLFVSAAVGIVMSNLGLVLLTPLTWQLYLAAIATATLWLTMRTSEQTAAN